MAASREYDIGALRADMDEAKRQQIRLFDLVTKQTEILTDMREEMRLSNESLKGRIDHMEPIVTSIDGLRQKGWGVFAALVATAALISGGVVAAAQAALRKLGIDIG